MTKTSPTILRSFRSDNRKSAIQNPKLAGIVAIVIAFAIYGAVAQAQQSPKIPRIGYLSVLSLSAMADRIEAFRQGCASLDTWTERTLLLSGDTERENLTA
jgi:hypothetical protein